MTLPIQLAGCRRRHDRMLDPQRRRGCIEHPGSSLARRDHVDRQIRGIQPAQRSPNERTGIDRINSGAEDALKIVAKLLERKTQ